MRIKRYEILLPLAYNDGTEIEREKFDQTFSEFIEKFGAATLDSVVAMGHWLYKGILYKDTLMRFRVDVEDTPDIITLLKKEREILFLQAT